MSRVLFVNPSRAGQGQIPINIPLLIGALKRDGHDVDLFDLTDYQTFEGISAFERIFFKEAPFNTDKITADRREFYGGLDGTPSGVELKRSDYASDFVQKIENFKPDLIAASSLSVDFSFITEMLAKARQHFPDLRIAIGGIHAILQPDSVENTGVYDFICVGEGETALSGIVQVVENRRDPSTVPGIRYKKGNAYLRNSMARLVELSEVTKSDFRCFDPIHFYRPFDGQRYKMLNYEFSRGCPFNCSYCVNGVLKGLYKGLGKYHRVKTIDQSIAELQELVAEYKEDVPSIVEKS